MFTVYGGEGTNYWQCEKCHKACDPKPQPQTTSSEALREKILDICTYRMTCDSKDRATQDLADELLKHFREWALECVGSEKITRVEVIDENGRSYVNWDDENKVSLSLQDDNRTLKVFIEKQTSPEKTPKR